MSVSSGVQEGNADIFFFKSAIVFKLNYRASLPVHVNEVAFISD